MSGTGSPAMKAALVCAAFLFGAAGCASSGAPGDLSQTAALAAQRGFSESSIMAGPFRLALFMRKQATAIETLVIYIEGDGAPWPTPYHPPGDPTPRSPMSLSLAVADPASAVAYLGRPCQFLDEDALRQCDRTYWVERRFSPEVIAAYDKALDQLKATYAARRLRLVGYSGGGVIAALLASRRDDVESLVTIAAPLPLAEWVTLHGASRLTGSLDPADGDSPSFPSVPSVHFAGEHDKTVPPQIVESFIRRKGGRLEIVSGFDHECCWARDWGRLLGRVPIREDIK